MKTKYVLPILLAIDTLILVFEANGLSISYIEAKNYLEFNSLTGYLSHIFTYFFGQNDISFRMTMIVLHIFSVLLLYKLSFWYLKREKERLFLVVIYMLLPGVMSSAILVNSAGFVIFATFLFLYIYKSLKDKLYSYALLILYSVLDNSFSYLFLGLFFYALHVKDKKFMILNMILIIINVYIYGTDIGGFPTGHFLDALGIYAAIFSPVIFIYLFYSLYRAFLTKQTDILWYISSVALIFSLLLSLRQRVHIEYYAPFVIPSILIGAKVFISSYKVRLPIFRKRYRLLFNLSILFLFINFVLVLFNKSLYVYIKNPKKHFAYNNHIAKELAYKLKQNNITCVKTNYKMQERLEFYGIKECNNNILSYYKTNNSIDVTISYNNIPVYIAYVTKINKKNI